MDKMFIVQPAKHEEDAYEVRKYISKRRGGYKMAEHASAIEPTSKAAWDRGVKIASNQKPCQLYLRATRHTDSHEPGQFRKERTFGNDPHNIKG